MLHNIKSLENYTEFYNLLKSSSNDIKGELFEEFTKYIFLYHPYYSGFTKSVWLFKELPLKVKKHLKLPKTDQGIDLVVLSQNDEYFAIQSKYRANTNIVIPWTNLGTFIGLTFGVASNFKGCFFVTNTNTITKNIKKNDKIHLIYGDFFNNFPDDIFNIIKGGILNKKINLNMPLYPRNYQTDAIHISYDYFKENNRGTIEMACGTGKTITMYWINDSLHSKLTIVAVPSIYLLSQTFKEWVLQNIRDGTNKKFILVGSDADIENDDGEYEVNGILITTDSNEIQQSVNKYIGKCDGLIILSTYQSSNVLIDALNTMNIVPDLLICDEAHKTVGNVSKKFGLLLDDNNLKINKRLFMTATPKIFNGDSDDDIMSMDNKEWYGIKYFTYNTYNAIMDGNLADYRIVTMLTDSEYIKQEIAKNNYVQYSDDEVVNTRVFGTAIMILNAFKKGEIHHLVTYHNSVLSSKKFHALLMSMVGKYGIDICIAEINGKHRMVERNGIIEEFEHYELSIMTSSKVLNEGVNIPIIDSVCFVDARHSTIDTIQSIGRALRLHELKIYAKILVPVIIDDIINIDENNLFVDLIRILKALNETDTGITAYFNCIKNGERCDRELIKYENYMSIQQVGDIEIDEWINGISFKIWGKIDAWEYKYNLLVLWIKNNNNNIPSLSSTNEIEKSLGGFCSNSRVHKKMGILSNDKIKKLQQIDGWRWDFDDAWNNHYNKLVEWINNNEGKIPSIKSKDKIEQKLGTFCNNQRTVQKNKELDDFRIKKLELIEAWYWRDENNIIKRPWNEQYNELLEWTVNNDNKIPSIKSKDVVEKKLGEFCNNQRYLQKNKKLDEYKIKQFELIDKWYWRDETTKIKKTWDENYELLILWINNNEGEFPSITSAIELEKSLGAFVNTQRANKKNGILNDIKISKLELIESWFWNCDDIWKTKYNNLLKWLKDNPSKKLPNKNSKNEIEKSLGLFCGSQRKAKKNNKLDDYKIEQLELIKNWYWIESTKK